MPLILIASERFAEHQTPPGHPESPERAAAMHVVVEEWQARGGEVVAPRSATHEQLARVHADDYLRQIADTAGRAMQFDPDTFSSPETIDIARLAAGAAVDGVERVLGGRHARALAVVRPPGHHAERHRAMGFCFYNNVAIAAAHARAAGADRVAIVDYDVHHGNGTQHIFESDPSVLYVSAHQFPYYPGTGASRETGKGAGRGFTVNVPLEVGAVDEDYRLVFAELIVPIVRAFRPSLILVSAGFDAHERDPLGGMRLSTVAFAAMTTELRRVAEECCDGRLVAVTEGGYDLQALADSLRGVVAALAGEMLDPVPWPEPTAIEPSRGHAAVSEATAALASYWPLTPL